MFTCFQMNFLTKFAVYFPCLQVMQNHVIFFFIPSSQKLMKALGIYHWLHSV